MGDVFLEQQIPGDPEHNHHDLVVINRERDKITVIDVTIPFGIFILFRYLTHTGSNCRISRWI